MDENKHNSRKLTVQQSELTGIKVLNGRGGDKGEAALEDYMMARVKEQTDRHGRLALFIYDTRELQ